MEKEISEIPISRQIEEIACHLAINNSECRVETTGEGESSMLLDAASVFLDNRNYIVTEIKSGPEDINVVSQKDSEDRNDSEKRVHEEDSNDEESSSSNNKKRRTSITNEDDKEGESAIPLADVEIDDFTCPKCLKTYESIFKKKVHMRHVHRIMCRTPTVVVPDGVDVDDYTCPKCLKKFDDTFKKKKHLRNVHKIMARTETRIRCNECNLGFTITNHLRKHLEEVHDMRITVEEHTFPNIEAFKVWKLNIERRDAVYFAQSAGHHITKEGKRYNYTCHRTGTYRPTPSEKNNRILKYRGSCKMGTYCTAAISCHETKEQVQVKYWPEHYGHAKGISSESLPGKDQNTSEKESIADGESFNEILKDVRSNLISESIVPSATRRKDKQILKEAFESDDYDSGLSDSESVDQWVRLCLQIEDSPVLYYRQEELADGGEEFMLVIMTEFQKQLLMTSEKTVICLDCMHRRKGGRFYLTCLSIVDECDVGFPVAFCISNKVDANVVRQFLMSVKKSTGPLCYSYLMSDSEDIYFDAWREIMDDTSKWLWGMWYMDYSVQTKLRRLFKKPDFEKKAEIYRVIKTLIECHSQTIFQTTFKKLCDDLLTDQLTAVQKFRDIVSSKYSPNVERWAYCYRTDMKTSVSFQLDALHRTLRFCCKEGRKTRLDKFIFVLMKFVKRKMLDRLMNILDDEKIKLVKETIYACHKAGLDISPEQITSLSDKVWLIKSDEEENVYVVRDYDSCPDFCTLQCDRCNICVHMYSCSCIPNMINANLCQHIHAVVWKILTPYHFSPLSSPTFNDNAESDSNDASTAQNSCTEELESVLNMAHEVYKSVRDNKDNLSSEALKLIKCKLSEARECIEVCSGKKPALNVEEVIQKVSLISNSPSSSQNGVRQPIVLRAFPKPNAKGGSSETMESNQDTELGLLQGESVAQQFVIYVSQENETEK